MIIIHSTDVKVTYGHFVEVRIESFSVIINQKIQKSAQNRLMITSEYRRPNNVNYSLICMNHPTHVSSLNLYSSTRYVCVAYDLIQFLLDCPTLPGDSIIDTPISSYGRSTSQLPIYHLAHVMHTDPIRRL